MLPGYSRCTCQDGCLDPAGIPSEGSIREDGKRCLVQLRRDAAKLYLRAAGYHSNSQAKLLAKQKAKQLAAEKAAKEAEEEKEAELKTKKKKQTKRTK